MIAVVDYGAGNTQSVLNALQSVLPAGVDALLTADAQIVQAADGVIVPGVGAAQDTIANLTRAGLVEPVLAAIRRDVPYLGICMGMQALMTYSEENGGQPCLDVIPGAVRKFVTDLPVPHMGWNDVRVTAAGQGHPGHSRPRRQRFAQTRCQTPAKAPEREAQQGSRRQAGEAVRTSG